MRSYSTLVVVVLLAGSANAALLWDNGIVPNGIHGGRPVSPPGFPDIRVADDVTFHGAVQINDFHANLIEDDGWTDDGNITFTVYADTGNGPGGVVATHTGRFTKTDTGDIYFGRRNYDYRIEEIDISLGEGTYWMGIRNANGGGRGTNYWTSSDGGADGPISDTGWFSLDAGATWFAEGPTWHHAFVVTGVPEPSTCLLLGLGGLALLRRDRSRVRDGAQRRIVVTFQSGPPP